MMKQMINSTVEERFNLWINKDHFSLISQQINVEEKKNDGVALVLCTIPNGQAYELTLEGKNAPHLVSQKCADGILLIECAVGHWELHIIECKRTVNKSKWGKTKFQFEASIQRATALLASIGISPLKIKLYTAVRDQEIQNEILADPVLTRLKSLGFGHLSPEEKETYHYVDWFHPSITIWLHENIPHEIIPLDEDGNGTLDLHCLSEA